MADRKRYDTTSPYTLANLITVLGFFSALYSIIMVQEAWVHYERSGYLAWPVASSFKALAAVILTFTTDAADGYIARKWKQRSKFGAFLDRARDKFIICPLVYYMYKYTQMMMNHGQELSDLYFYLKMLIWAILIIEGILILGGVIAAALGGRIESHWTGKWKMGFECATVGIWILAFLFSSPAVFFTHWSFKIFIAFLTTSAFFSMASFLSYLSSWFNGSATEATA